MMLSVLVQEPSQSLNSLHLYLTDAQALCLFFDHHTYKLSVNTGGELWLPLSLSFHGSDSIGHTTQPDAIFPIDCTG